MAIVLWLALSGCQESPAVPAPTAEVSVAYPVKMLGATQAKGVQGVTEFVFRARTSLRDPVLTWDLGDGTEATGPEIRHVFAGMPRQYTVMLTATDGDATVTAFALVRTGNLTGIWKQQVFSGRQQVLKIVQNGPQISGEWWLTTVGGADTVKTPLSGALFHAQGSRNFEGGIDISLVQEGECRRTMAEGVVSYSDLFPARTDFNFLGGLTLFGNPSCGESDGAAIFSLGEMPF